MMRRALVAAALLLAAVPAQTQDADPADEVLILRNHLRQLRGVSISMAGVNMPEAMRVLAERLIEIDERLTRIERAANEPKK